MQCAAVLLDMILLLVFAMLRDCQDQLAESPDVCSDNIKICHFSFGVRSKAMHRRFSLLENGNVL